MPSYNVLNTDLNIGGVIIDGGGTDNFITVTIPGGLGTVQEGVGGESVFSFTNSKTLVLTISQLETSYAARRLDQLARDQYNVGRTQAAANGGAGYEVSSQDTGTKEGFYSPEAYFSDLGTMTKGLTATNRVFEVQLLQARGSLRLGAEIPNS